MQMAIDQMIQPYAIDLCIEELKRVLISSNNIKCIHIIYPSKQLVENWNFIVINKLY